MCESFGTQPFLSPANRYYQLVSRSWGGLRGFEENMPTQYSIFFEGVYDNVGGLVCTVAAWHRLCQFGFPARRIRGIRVDCIRTRVLDVTLAQPHCAVFRVPARARMTPLWLHRDNLISA
jgi:hypothetical protein